MGTATKTEQQTIAPIVYDTLSNSGQLQVGLAIVEQATRIDQDNRVAVHMHGYDLDDFFGEGLRWPELLDDAIGRESVTCSWISVYRIVKVLKTKKRKWDSVADSRSYLFDVMAELKSEADLREFLLVADDPHEQLFRLRAYGTVTQPDDIARLLGLNPRLGEACGDARLRLPVSLLGANPVDGPVLHEAGDFSTFYTLLDEVIELDDTKIVDFAHDQAESTLFANPSILSEFISEILGEEVDEQDIDDTREYFDDLLESNHESFIDFMEEYYRDSIGTYVMDAAARQGTPGIPYLGDVRVAS